MRNVTQNLEKILRRADPTARVMVEARVELQSDIRQRYDQWLLADDGSGGTFPTNAEVLSDGGVRLKSTGTTGPSSSTHTSTSLARGDSGAAIPYFGKLVN